MIDKFQYLGVTNINVDLTAEFVKMMVCVEVGKRDFDGLIAGFEQSPLKKIEDKVIEVAAEGLRRHLENAQRRA